MRFPFFEHGSAGLFTWYQQQMLRFKHEIKWCFLLQDHWCVCLGLELNSSGQEQMDTAIKAKQWIPSTHSQTSTWLSHRSSSLAVCYCWCDAHELETKPASLLQITSSSLTDWLKQLSLSTSASIRVTCSTDTDTHNLSLSHTHTSHQACHTFLSFPLFPLSSVFCDG